tara:strand:- start:546 stop:1148 length:603 start_codon:yes stop_codon:yes gene_type:complete
MNITHFANHIASRKANPIGVELKESKIELPCEYSDVQLKFHKARANGACSLQEGTVTAIDLEGDRQWIRVSFDNDYKDEGFLKWLKQTADALIKELPGASGDAETVERSGLLLSRFRKDYTKKEKVPIRLWKMDKTGVLQPYNGCVSEGCIVICSMDELRAYTPKNSSESRVVAELNRDIVVVRRSNKRRRIIQYFSDED